MATVAKSPAEEYGDALALELARHVTWREKREPMGEVLLFHALADAFSTARASRVVSEVYHGSGHQVQFSDGTHEHRCELCDLLIVAFAEQHPLDARMTLLQAKFERRRVARAAKSYRFAANVVQCYLLSQRPLIRGWGGFDPPGDLLRSATRASVGSFGFFFITKSGYDLAYASADTLREAPSTATGRYRDVTVAASPTSRGPEAIFAPSAAEFGARLSELRIGTPVSVLGASNSEKWLHGVLAAIASERPASLAGALLHFAALAQGRRDADVPPGSWQGRRDDSEPPRGGAVADWEEGEGGPTVVVLRTTSK